MYPNDPHREEEFLPYGPGYLTNVNIAVTLSQYIIKHCRRAKIKCMT